MNDAYVRLIGTEVERTFSTLKEQLRHWGETARGEREVLGFPAKTIIYVFMSSGIEAKRRAQFQADDNFMDTNRLISKLPNQQRLVLYVQYVGTDNLTLENG